MSEPARRSKMISFRVSKVEYDVVKARYRAFGARNISDLARLALQHVLGGSSPAKSDLALQVAALGDRVEALETNFSLMLNELGNLD